ncbi:MAG: hypothetical protein QNJ16_07015 [Rhodobacter sp.]|nr:hypothetical protein [Rhodobacter sp.]
MKRAPLAIVLALAACAVETFEIPLLGPYREPNDPCREVAPGRDTTPLMAPDSDLVACPNDPAVLQLFIFDVSAVEVKRFRDWVLLRVPEP